MSRRNERGRMRDRLMQLFKSNPTSTCGYNQDTMLARPNPNPVTSTTVPAQLATPITSTTQPTQTTGSPPSQQVHPIPSTAQLPRVTGLPPSSQNTPPVTPTTLPAQTTLVSPSQPSPNTPAKDLWTEALQKLSEKEKKTILQHVLPATSSNSMPAMLYDLCAVTAQKRALCEAKGWKFELHGRQVILRDVAEKVIVWINKFKEVGDVAANFDPVHASLPWAGVRLMLQVLSRRVSFAH
jgi:ankyrin repeat domain-containing protein 50